MDTLKSRMGCMALCAFVFLCAVPSPGQAREVPVYPGAELVFDPAPGEEPECCDFLTRDPLAKVVAFYEVALKTKGLDPEAFGAKYPDLKHQADALSRETPAGVKVRIFVLAEHKVRGKTAAETFDVASTADGVRFSIMQDQFSPKDARFGAEWEAKTSGPAGPGKTGSSDWTKLKTALPASPPAGFTVDEVQGGNGGPGQPSFVQASYQKVVRKGRGQGPDDADESVSIDVMVTDMAGDPESVREALRVQDEWERAVKVKGAYDGKEIAVRDGGNCRESGKVFVVHRRYVVEIKTHGFCDLPVIDRIIESMRLGQLRK